MIRAASWDLRWKQQKLRLLTRQLNLELRYPISTSRPQPVPAQQHAASLGDERSPAHADSPTAETTRQSSNQDQLPEQETISKPTAKGPHWDVTSAGAPNVRRGRSASEFRDQRMRRRLSRGVALDALDTHVQRRLAALGFSQDTVRPHSETSALGDDFASKFTERREASGLDGSNSDALKDEFAADFFPGQRSEADDFETETQLGRFSATQEKDAGLYKHEAGVEGILNDESPGSWTQDQTARLSSAGDDNTNPSGNRFASHLEDSTQPRETAEGQFTEIFHDIYEEKGWPSHEKAERSPSTGRVFRDGSPSEPALSKQDFDERHGPQGYAGGAFDQIFKDREHTVRPATTQQPDSNHISSQVETIVESTTPQDDIATPLGPDQHARDVFSQLFQSTDLPDHNDATTSAEHLEDPDLQTDAFKSQLHEVLEQFQDRADQPTTNANEVSVAETTSTAVAETNDERASLTNCDFSYTAVTKGSSDLDRSWEGQGPSWWIHCCVSGHQDQHVWRRQVAQLRTIRPPIIVLQLLMRRQALRSKETDERSEILQHLPQGSSRSLMIRKMAELGLTPRHLMNVADVLEAESDEERCRRFLALDKPKPIWLLNFLLRPQSSIQDPETLNALIGYAAATFCRPWNTSDQEDDNSEVYKAEIASEVIAPEDLAHVVLLLSMRAMTLESRLLPKIAELAAQYIEKMSTSDWHPEKVFYNQCELFNAALAAFRPSKLRLPSTTYRWMPPHWEAQKILLNMSTSLPRQLLVDRLGYRSVREVLSSLDKDQNEMHNALRHRESWPPYLEPTDGIDDAVDPEANWSRAVSAGTLQQDAGYSLTPRDEVLDILQGRAPNMTPTIKQRTINAPHPAVTPWEASIRATRNVQEAWDRFRSPPTAESKPGVHEYGALLMKYLNPQAEVGSLDLPGDKARNFPTMEDVNLTEFEKTRRRPPEIGKLLDTMQKNDIKLTGAVLYRLISWNGFMKSFDNEKWYLSQEAPLSKIHKRLKRILKLSDLGSEQYQPLFEKEVYSRKALRNVPMPLFVAYIQRLASFRRGVAPGLLLRAMHFCEKRFADDEEAQRWAQHCWGMVLKASARRPADPRFLRHGLVSQINSYHYIVQSIAAKTPLTSSTIMQFAQSVDKASRRVLSEFWEMAKDEKMFFGGPLIALYGREDRRASIKERIAGIKPEYTLMMQSLCRLVAQLTGTVRSLIEREAKVQSLLAEPMAQSVHEMRARSDPVRADQAERLMWAWAYAGEYETMAWYLEWLVEQWDSAQLQEELQNILAVPPFVDFGDTLAIFGRYAEPMLPADRVLSLRQKINDAQVVWQWPTTKETDERLKKTSVPQARLRYVQAWTRFWQAKDRNQDVSGMGLPEHWTEFWENRFFEKEEEEEEGYLATKGPQTWDGMSWPETIY